MHTCKGQDKTRSIFERRIFGNDFTIYVKMKTSNTIYQNKKLEKELLLTSQ